MTLCSLPGWTAGGPDRSDRGASHNGSGYWSKIRRDFAGGSQFEGSGGSCLDGGRVLFAASMAVPVPFTSAGEIDILPAGFAVPKIPDGGLVETVSLV